MHYRKKSLLRRHRSLFFALAAFAAVAVLGVYLLRNSSAAGYTVAVEAEGGQRTGSAVEICNDTASGKKAVRFGSTGGTGCTGGGGNPLEPGGGIIPAGVKLLHDGSIGQGENYDGTGQWDLENGTAAGTMETVSDGPGHEYVMKVVCDGQRVEARADALGEGTINEGDEWWMPFSVKFPKAPPSASFALIWQVHAGHPSPGGSPPVAFNYTPTLFDIGNNRTGVTHDIGPLPIGQWKDYVVHIKFSTGSGHLQVWENGQKKVDTAAKTLAANGTSYFKYGVYGGTGTTVLHDNLKVYTP